MTIENLRIGILLLYILKEAFEYLVQGLNLKHHLSHNSRTVPPSVKPFLLVASGMGIPLPFWPLHHLSRRYEREADRVSYELTEDPKNTISALVKLSEKNLSNLYPHPLYVLLYYSHPPITKRIRYIRNRDTINTGSGY